MPYRHRRTKTGSIAKISPLTIHRRGTNLAPRLLAADPPPAKHVAVVPVDDPLYFPTAQEGDPPVVIPAVPATPVVFPAPRELELLERRPPRPPAKVEDAVDGAEVERAPKRETHEGEN